ncbi:MAG: MBL fold metallo-hydrolase [Oscillospiraceae bacterium]|nr:MBL fold metallo-hydrolase [Oscillospiraceae bacterium]
MKLTFYGAARMVTGSCFMLEAAGKHILIDCGMRQGKDDDDMPNEELEFSPASVDALIVTHAHIDHSGRVPLLGKLGYRGPVYTTRLTAQLMGIMLMDSAHIQQSDAEYKSTRQKRRGEPPVEPLYTAEDVTAVLADVRGVGYGVFVDVSEGIRIRFNDAGHLLGSSSVEVWATENGVTKKLVFSGDIGNLNQPIVRDPQPVEGGADYVIMESTYGDRDHEPPASYTEHLAQILDETFVRGGNVIIPSFAVGRTQELLYFIREIKERRLVKSLPDFKVYVDSPLANEATSIYSGDLDGFVDEDAEHIIRDGGCMFCFDGLTLSKTLDESKALNTDMTPKVIISASGMCDAGRIRHHLKHNLWRPESTVVFVGFQSPGTLGRILLDGAKTVKLVGEAIKVAARIETVQGLSAHADKTGLIRWLEAISPRPDGVFVVHGENDVAVGFAETLRGLGYSAHAPEPGEVYDVISDRVAVAGKHIQPRPRPSSGKENPLFEALVAAGRKLLDVISRNRGSANRDLKAFAKDIDSLIDKWDR